MSTTLSLEARLSLNKTGFDAGMASAAKEVEKFGKQTASRIGQAFSAAAILAFGREIIDTGKEIDKLADKLGVTAKEAQKIRLEEMLGGDIGKGGVIFTDKALEDVRLMDRLIIKLRESSKALTAGWLSIGAPGSTHPATSMMGLLTSLAKVTGFVSAEPPHTQQKDREKAERADVLSIEQEIADIRAKGAFEQLTDEQKLDALLKDRIAIFEKLGAIGVLSPVGRANLEKRGAQLDREIDGVGDRINKSNPSAGTPGLPQASGLPGVFIGEHGKASNPAAKQTELLGKIHERLSTTGIVVRDTR